MRASSCKICRVSKIKLFLLACLKKIFHYIRGLNFEDAPDYDYMRNIINQFFIDKKLEIDDEMFEFVGEEALMQESS
jgi:hypothetical protein